jgi:starvation-inducible DNA-binding protein
MDKLIESMKRLLADTFAFSLKAHNYHWNVEGPDFSQYHAFFGSLYDETNDAVDGVAEQIRALDAYAPGALSRFSDLTSIEDELTVPSANEMINRLSTDNQKVIITLAAVHTQAELLGNSGLLNFIEGRQDIHAKHAWMLKASGKRT